MVSPSTDFHIGNRLAFEEREKRKMAPSRRDWNRTMSRTIARLDRDLMFMKTKYKRFWRKADWPVEVKSPSIIRKVV
jgi:hypothetical protein